MQHGPYLQDTLIHLTLMQVLEATLLHLFVSTFVVTKPPEHIGWKVAAKDRQNALKNPLGASSNTWHR